VKRIVDLFYADEDEDPGSVALALEICAGCPVQEACLEISIDEQFGIWGNRTANERRIIRKRRRETEG
jgi:hypothetical protein